VGLGVGGCEVGPDVGGGPLGPALPGSSHDTIAATSIRAAPAISTRRLRGEDIGTLVTND